MIGNRQDGNVGNRGDVAKHAALVGLARWMGARHPAAAINWLDTHAYRLWSHPAAGVVDWEPRYPGMTPLVELQRPWLARGEYLCSSGLIHALLPEARFHLSEAHPPTRRLLAAQLRAVGKRPVRLLPDLAGWAGTSGLSPGPLLALLDPFRLTASEWRGCLGAVAALWRPGEDGVLLVFDSRKPPEPLSWPEPPPGWQGPLTTWRGGAYGLACYAAAGKRGNDSPPPLEK